MKTLRVSQNEAINVINGIVGSPFMGISQRTYPRLLKKDRDSGLPANFAQNEIAKVSETRIKVGSEYVTRVLNQLKREEKDASDYKAGFNSNPIEKIAKNGILGTSVKNGKLMIEYGTLPNVKPIVNYLYNNGIIEKSKIGNILPVRSKAKNQGTKKEVQIRKVYFDNILDFTINDTKYLITQ